MVGLGDIKSMCKMLTKIKALLHYAQKKKNMLKNGILIDTKFCNIKDSVYFLVTQKLRYIKVINERGEKWQWA